MPSVTSVIWLSLACCVLLVDGVWAASCSGYTCAAFHLSNVAADATVCASAVCSTSECCLSAAALTTASTFASKSNGVW